MSTTKQARIKAACRCGKKYRVRADLAGKRGRCKCGLTFVVPDPSEAVEPEPTKKCPWCETRIKQSESYCSTCADEAAWKASEESASESRPWWKELSFQIAAGLCAVTVLVTSVYQTSLSGPEFMSFFLVLGVVLLFAGLGGRAILGSTAIAVLCILTFEAIGGIRILYGTSQGMHKFSNLTSMMFVGGFLSWSVLFRGAGGGGSSSSSSGFFSGSSCGSSCGGGCGGGGCGGCGG